MPLMNIVRRFAETLETNLQINQIEELEQIITIHYPATHRDILRRQYREYVNAINQLNENKRYEIIEEEKNEKGYLSDFFKKPIRIQRLW